MTKTCKVCNKELSLDNFSTTHKGKYYRSDCKSCVNKKTRINYTKLPTSKLLYKAAKNRCKKTGLEFTIKENDIIVPSTCPILGIPLNEENKGNQSFDSPSLDRIDSTRGYTPDNISVVSLLANRMKQNATRDQLLSFANNIQIYLDSQPTQSKVPVKG